MQSEADPLVGKPKLRVLFLCTNNACRSQMAEGMLLHLAGDKFDVFSAGVEPTELHPLAVEIMAGLRIDISGQRSKSAREFSDQQFDYIITVCDWAKQTYPIFLGKHKKFHWPLEDPATVDGSESEELEAIRKAENQIQDNIWLFLEFLA